MLISHPKSFSNMSILSEYNDLIRKLEAEHIDYATCGGLAMAVHGFVRATKDIDLLIQEKDLAAAFEAARTLGYDVEGLPLNFDKRTRQIRRISKIDKASKSLVTIDFILVTEVMKDVWEGREIADWGTGHTWVVSRDGLIKMKSMAGRPIDLVDIERLEAGDES